MFLKNNSNNLKSRVLFLILLLLILFSYSCSLSSSNNNLLTQGNWVEGTISNNETLWYYFNAQKGVSYDIYWDDSYDGSGKYTADILVSAYHQDKTSLIFELEDSAYNSPFKITATSDEKIYLAIIPYDDNSTGTFAIKYDIPFQRSDNIYDDIQTGLTSNFGPTETWTFMIYLDGDNNLEPYAIDDFNEMVSGLNGLNKPNIKVVVLLDRIPGYDDTSDLGEGSDWTGAKIFEINQYGSYSKTDSSKWWFQDGDEINMGDPLTLDNFINYCKTNYSATHYALILWNHGGGTRSKQDYNIDSSGISKAICWDDSSTDSSGSDALYLDEVQQAISSNNNNFNSSSKLDFLGFDACLMGMVEVAYEFKDYVKVFSASPAEEQGNGWDYQSIFSNMSGTNSDDPVELGKLIVKSYHDYIVSAGLTDQTMVSVDLTNISSLKTVIDSFAAALYNENQKQLFENIRDVTYHYYDTDDSSLDFPFYDLNDFAQQIINYNDITFSNNLKLAAQDVIIALSSSVIAAYGGSNYGNYYGSGNDVKRGLSIFISRGNKIYNAGSGPLTHYAYQWWYTSIDTESVYGPQYLYGNIDFCDFDNDGIIETWKELFEAWYDPDNQYTNDTY